MDTQADLDELVAGWTLVGDEFDLVAGKQGSNRLGFGLSLRYYGEHGRFLDDATGLSSGVIDFVARQVGVVDVDLVDYEWGGRTGRFHRAQIREHFRFRECSVDDAEAVDRNRDDWSVRCAAINLKRLINLGLDEEGGPLLGPFG